MKEMHLVVLISGLGLSASAFAGAILEVETTSYFQEPPVVSSIEISSEDGSSRMDVTSVNTDEAGTMIFLGEEKEMIAIDHEREEYYVLDEASMQKMGAQLDSAMQQMEEQLQGLPPEQRAMMEKMMKDQLPPSMQQSASAKVTVEKTGNSDSINGFDCEYYEVLRDDVKVRELCVTSWDEIPGGREVADSMLEMAGFFENMAEAFSGGMNLMAAQQEMFEHMQELDGYPVLSREFDEAGKLVSESILKAADSEDIDAAAFEPPADYRKKQLGM